MAIVSHKVQTTRHRIKAFLNVKDEYQIIFSDTPGIINPKYKLHERMMAQVKGALEDADVALLLYDLQENNFEEAHAIFTSLKLKVPAILVANKSDAVKQSIKDKAEAFFTAQTYCKKYMEISALEQKNTGVLLAEIISHLPEGLPYYDEDDMSDMPTKFFVSEMIREKVYELFGDEIPYHTAVNINEFKEKTTLVKIQADIIVQRESQKAIIIGDKGSMIKQVGSLARKDIEEFLQQKIFLELFVKVRPKWRDNEQKLKEYGYK